MAPSGPYGGNPLVNPEEEKQEDEDFEPAEEETVEVFETVEEEEVPEVVEEFDGFDENAPDEISSSGFKTKGGEIPDYEPTVDEVLSYAMGKTGDPSEPVMDDADDMPDFGAPEPAPSPALGEDELPPDLEKALDEALDEVLDDVTAPDDKEEEEVIEGLDEVFDDDEEKE